MPEKKKPVVSLESIYQVWGWILLVWSLYRYFFSLPEWLDEFVFKPLVFVLPVLWFVQKWEKRPVKTLGLTTKNLFPSIYIGLGFGFVFALEGIAANALKYGKIQINPIAAIQQYGLLMLLVISLATAFSEELLNRGFLFNRILEKTKNMPYAAFVSTILFVLLHVPVLVTSLKLQGATLVLFFVTDFVLGFANSLLFFNTGSLIAPILVHVFWNMTVALYL
ncbi:MAG: type II CAAX endopeptidase family protein [bacterium]|nr:type II CAAX endopeptidase family protein [bacterium]